MDKNLTDSLLDTAADLAGLALLFYLAAGMALVLFAILWGLAAAALWVGLFVFHAGRAAWRCFSSQRAETRLTPPPAP